MNETCLYLVANAFFFSYSECGMPDHNKPYVTKVVAIVSMPKGGESANHFECIHSSISRKF